MDTRNFCKMSSEKAKSEICCPVCRASHVPIQGELMDGVYAATCQACGHFFKFRPVSQIRSTVSFTVNGKQYSVGNDVEPTTTLADFLREQRISMGTKIMCREGGCGMCVLETKLYEPVSKERKSYAVKSCLCPVFLCDDWEITTIEGLGNQRSGLHPIQDTLAGYNGSQCGFCSPAQIMNMYALLQQIPEPTQQQVEDIYDGIICRCTGYRAIMDAMKSFAKPDDKMEKKCMADIEDLNGKLCKKTGQRCHGNCKKQMTSEKNTAHGAKGCPVAETNQFR
ncbi:hypothetical protein CHS0354_031883 [Potamilus streckersoni]|uniref:2Fe-2S ferredoxin-type domain-containing protein n=1 Tax=Potamilus streckersoni TaxID=2493646 RepID=A0AAE0RXI8_9BIVA|nr:hypothetical protein CHS0354_031883 [Potamilus streckersoni]